MPVTAMVLGKIGGLWGDKLSYLSLPALSGTLKEGLIIHAILGKYTINCMYRKRLLLLLVTALTLSPFQLSANASMKEQFRQQTQERDASNERNCRNLKTMLDPGSGARWYLGVWFGPIVVTPDGRVVKIKADTNNESPLGVKCKFETYQIIGKPFRGNEYTTYEINIDGDKLAVYENIEGKIFAEFYPPTPIDDPELKRYSQLLDNVF